MVFRSKAGQFKFTEIDELLIVIMEQTTPGTKQPSPSSSTEKFIRLRRPDAGAEEFIQFLRESQIRRETTEMRIKRKPLLPGIGHYKARAVKIPTEVILSETEDRNDVQNAKGQETSNSDTEQELERLSDTTSDNSIALSNTLPRKSRSKKMQSIRSSSQLMDPVSTSAEELGGLYSDLFIFKPKAKIHIHKYNINTSRRATADVKILPPISKAGGTERPSAPTPAKDYRHLRHDSIILSDELRSGSSALGDRESIPSRPSAPAPNRTPPPPGVDLEDYMKREPIDYIDE